MQSSHRYSFTPSTASNPLSLRGMVTSPHYLASQAGRDILRKGGTAVDAAIAAAAVLSVVYPHMCGLGGDNFWLIYDAASQNLRSLNGSGRAARAATAAHYTGRGHKTVPTRGPLAALTVPGAVSGWGAAFEHSKNTMQSPLNWADLLAPAREHAEEGFAVSHSLAGSLAFVSSGKPNYCLHQSEGFRDLYFTPDGHPPVFGAVMRLPQLAETLERLACDGPKEFYEGHTARAIITAMQQQGGLLTQEDLSSHTADWTEPLRVDYRGYTACTPPPNCQGMATLEILNILNQMDITSLGEGTADYYHVMAEATREAFIDRQLYLTDPEFAHIPTNRLLSKEHGRQQAARISMRKCAGVLPPLPPGGDTIWLGVVDAAGNAVSLIQSIYHEFGSGVVASGAGFVLQNRGCAFALEADHVNCLLPGKRTLHTLTPAMLLKDGNPHLVYGSMGGDGQPQTIAAMTTRIVDFGMSPQDAVNAPRWLLGRSWGAESNDLKLEGRIPESVAQELTRRGHEVRQIEDFTELMGHAGAILRRPNGIWQGATDPRGDGQVAAL
ncbi:MAG: gamma-glutamyltransferase [Desulfovibrio sp.]|uniref:gamma-glutamyltransferase n=1 Tax=Desulfovibrio sp. TaxID=885 RepID=UPI0039E39FAE